jgi:pilus assembly protein CpaB
MRFSSLLTVVMGLTVAGGSAFMANEYFANQKSSVSVNEESALVHVVVASQDIVFGQAIEGHMLSTIAWPRDAVPANTFAGYEDLLPDPGDQPRRARRAISQGELVRASQVSDFGEKVTIVQTLAANHRAMAIEVSAATAVGGFVTPGDFVDVLLTQGRQESLRTVTILQNARIIGVDQDADERSDAPEIARTVTVEVTPEQGQRLALAQEAGTLSLTLRTLEASEDVPLESIRLSDVMRDLSPVPESVPIKTIIVRRGTEVSVSEIN